MTFSDASSVDKVLAHGSHDLDGKKVEYSLDISSSSVIYFSFFNARLHTFVTIMVNTSSIYSKYLQNENISRQID